MVFVTGDCHGKYGRFSQHSFPQQKEMDANDVVIIAGDFGYWDRSLEQEYWLNYLEKKDFTIAFVDGNHENFDMLSQLPEESWKGGRVHFIRKNIIHLMRGQMYRIQGKRFYTFGGARSHDIQDGILELGDPQLREKVAELEAVGASYRIRHLSWWEEELPSEQECRDGLRCLEENRWECDYIISHCAPTEILEELSLGLFDSDALTDYLSVVRSKTRYREWFFGHYHMDKRIDNQHTALYRRILRIL